MEPGSRHLRQLLLAVLIFSIFFNLNARGAVRAPSLQSDQPRQMLATQFGFLVLNPPEGWVYRDQRGMTLFLPKGVTQDEADVWFYISTAPVGPNEDDKNAASYIQSDIAGFKARFSRAEVREEESIALPRVKDQAKVYTFRSGEANNAFEQVAYIPDSGRVVLVTLSARNQSAYDRSVALFRSFVGSWGGSIQVGSQK